LKIIGFSLWSLLYWTQIRIQGANLLIKIEATVKPFDLYINRSQILFLIKKSELGICTVIMREIRKMKVNLRGPNIFNFSFVFR
jgi:hypothetical protein